MTPTGPLLVIALGSALGAAAFLRFPRAWLALVLVGTAAGLGACAFVLWGGPAWDWPGGFEVAGQPVHLRLDGLSALFLALVCVVGGAGAVYSMGYWTDAAHPRSASRGRLWWSEILLAMGFILVATNGLHFLIAWEGFVLGSFFLITLDQSRREARQAGWLYLAASHVGTLCLFGLFGVLAARLGTWELGPVRGHPELAPLFWLALIGFGIKAGAFPLHIWLPSAHGSAPSHASALLSGVVIKMGIYGLIRFGGWLPVPAAAGWVITALGLVSAVLGVAFALGQHDLKRLLAYHSVENIGIILIGFGFALVAASRGHAAWGLLAMAGALLHVWNHGLFKALLFLGAGSVLHATGCRRMSGLGGLWRRMPWTAALFALGAAAISGLPPLNGFVSEWLVYLGLFDAVHARGASSLLAVVSAILLGVTGALALACFTKASAVVFLGAARSEAARRAHESGWAMLGPMVALAALCAAIGLFPVLAWPAVARAAADWTGAGPAAAAPAELRTLGLCSLVVAILGAAAAALLWRRTAAGSLRRASTWCCGYAEPTARMQYTAGSFAGIITGWFEGVLLTHRTQVPAGQGPGRAPIVDEGVPSSLDDHTPEAVLERVVGPAARVVMRVALGARSLQHGRLPAYLLYVLAGLAGLAAIIFLACILT